MVEPWRSDIEWETFCGIIEAGDTANVSRLLDEHPDWLRRRDPELLNLAIHVAAGMERADIVELLARRGSEVDPRDYAGMTPLCYAADNLCFEAASVLIRFGADVRVRDNGERTPLALAAGLHGRRAGRFADLLLEHGASLDLYCALALDRMHEARALIAEDSQVLANTARPEALLAMVVNAIADKIVRRTGVGPSYRRDLAASGRRVDDGQTVAAAILEDMDVLDSLISAGALRYPSYDAVYGAVQLPDPIVAERLLAAGAERVPGPRSGNLCGLFHASQESACGTEMRALLERYGVPNRVNITLK